MKSSFWIAGVFVFLFCGGANGAPASSADAGLAAQGWLRTSPRPLGASLRASIHSVDTARDVNGTPLYHVISLDPEGYVICSSDTGIEPILAFSDSGQYEFSPENPLYVLVENDTRGRLQQIQTQTAKVAGAPTLQRTTAVQSGAEEKWGSLLSLAESKVLPMSSGLSSVNDPRVDPFIQSRWNQSTVGGSPCYNYYTPNNYVCGCNNTAWAQVMRYFQYPTRPVGTNSFQIYVDGNPTSLNLRGGDGAGGAYSWDLMPLIPSSPSTAERQAIGALCADIGVASGTSYTPGGSGAWTSEQTLKDIFFYSNVCSSSGQSDLVNAIRPNLDARLPLLLHISGPGEGHAVVCDGYGFNLNSTYYHLNMGWGGSKDAWYNLLDVDTDWYKFDTISGFMYNIYTNGTGEIISGRVLDGSTPVDGAVVSAVGGGVTNSVVTDARGIYALTRLPSSTQFILTVQKSDMQFGARTVATGLSAYTKTGNAWSNDFYRGLFTLQVNAGTGSGFYTNGSRVTITANAPVVGQSFDRWIGDTAFIADINDSSTTITMPSQSISITASLTKPDNLNCTTNSGKITITKYIGSGGAVFIPSTIEGKPVTGIGTNAFSGNNGLISVTISDSVTDIGDEAFSGCSSLTTITVDMNNSAYSSLDGVLFNKSQTTLIACPEGKVGSITIPASVSYLRGDMFSGCVNLTAITVDTNNSAYSSVDGVLLNKSQTALIRCPEGKAGGYTIPDSVTRIGYQAFSDCIGLTDITTGTGLTSIGGWAFYNCAGLRYVTILNSVTNIETCAFYYCTNLTSLIIPDNVESIGDWAFASCSSLTSAMIGKGVTSIGNYAFSSCRNLDSVYFQGAAPSLGGDSVFSGGNSATIYYLPGAAGMTTPWGGRPTVLWNPAYLLIVNYGSGGGSYTNLQRVGISANPPAPGKTFDNWTGTTQYVEKISSPTTTVTMPATATFALSTSNVVLTATYKDAYYTLTVTGGSGSSSYTNRAQVKITAGNAPAVGKTFDRWEGATQYVASVTSSTTTVTMPAQAITLTATYRDILYTLTVNNGTGGGSYTNQQRATIAAAAPEIGKTFDCWMGDTQYVASVTSSNTTVTMPAQDITVTATYKDILYSLTVEQGSGGGTSYTYRQQVEIEAEPPPVGYVFYQWVGATQYVSNVTSSVAVVTMPAQDLALSATYRDENTYVLTISGGTGGGFYTAGESVEITADTPPPGRTFDRWTGDTQYVADASSATTTVTMPSGQVSLSSQYRAILYTLTASASGKGRIEPFGEIQIEHGNTQIFTAVPDVGYQIKHWLAGLDVVAEGQSTLSVIADGDKTVSVVFEAGLSLSSWLVFEGRSQVQRLDEAGGKRGEPVVLKETLSTLLVVNRDRFGETNAVLVSWGKSGVPSAIPVEVSMDDSYPVSAKNDKSGRPAAERNLWSLSIRDDGGKSLLIGTFDGAYRYDKSGVLIRVQQRASLTGAGLSPEDPSFSAGLLRLNQTAGDALTKADGDFAVMAAALRAQIKKLPTGVSDGNLSGLLQDAAGE